MFCAPEFGFAKVIATMQKLAPTHGQRWRLPRAGTPGSRSEGWIDVENSC